jgi:hypothetical protein
MSAPKHVKQPSDRKPKAETDADRTVTVRGVEVTLSPDALDDFELLDDLAELQRNQKRGASRVPSMLRRLAGDDGFRAVADGLRDPASGRVPATVAVVFVFEVFQALNPNG